MSVHLPILALLIVAVPLCAAAQSNRTDDRSAVYYLDTMWQHKTPRESGLDPGRLKEAIDFAVAKETKNPRDLVLNHYQIFSREPFGYAIGPIKDRGDPTGLVIHHGYIVAEWGEPRRVDMTHSVTKSMLSTVIGVAYDRGMIRDINETVQSYMAPIQAFSLLMAGNKVRSPRHLRSFVSVRHAPQSHHHMGSHASPDQRLGRHAMGQTRLGRPAGAERCPMDDAAALSARHCL
jgi:hypothetical protein